MTKLQNSSVSLVLWALSPRLRGNFNNSFDLEFLGGIRTMPISEKSSITIMDSLLRLANIEQDDLIRKCINRQMDFLTQLRPYRHAECTLIHHLTDLKSRYVAMKFCSYLGVSKLSCLGCTKWIDKFNNCHNTRWTTCGTHGKIYPWGYFETEKDITKDTLRTIRQVHSEVQEVFAHHCRTRLGPKRDTNSAISGSSVDDVDANFKFKWLQLDKVLNYIENLRSE